MIRSMLLVGPILMLLAACASSPAAPTASGTSAASAASAAIGGIGQVQPPAPPDRHQPRRGPGVPPVDGRARIGALAARGVGSVHPPYARQEDADPTNRSRPIRQVELCSLQSDRYAQPAPVSGFVACRLELYSCSHLRVQLRAYRLREFEPELLAATGRGLHGVDLLNPFHRPAHPQDVAADQPAAVALMAVPVSDRQLNRRPPGGYPLRAPDRYESSQRGLGRVGVSATRSVPHWEAMCAVATRLADAGERDDVLQNALLLAWRWRAQFDPARGSERGWLLAITANEARKSHRRRRARRARRG